MTRHEVRRKRTRARTRSGAELPEWRGQVVEARVVEVIGNQSARVELSGGRHATACLPQHVSPAWLREALEVGPVEAGVALLGSGRAQLWCVFPGPEHAAVIADVELVGRDIRVRAQGRVEVTAPRSTLTLDHDGKATLRGDEVLTRARGANRIKGASVRIN